MSSGHLFVGEESILNHMNIMYDFVDSCYMPLCIGQEFPGCL